MLPCRFLAINARNLCNPSNPPQSRLFNNGGIGIFHVLSPVQGTSASVAWGQVCFNSNGADSAPATGACEFPGQGEGVPINSLEEISLERVRNGYHCHCLVSRLQGTDAMSGGGRT